MQLNEVEHYLSKVSEPHRSTLWALRNTILEIIPEAEEVISYGFPGYKINGKVICGFDAFKNHCSFFPHSSLVIPVLQDELKDYKTSKGALQFPADRPLSKDLVEKLIEVRLKQLDSQIGNS
jgi:uncharacterized protein YdhG (YjbR/CyaY superfamily)